MKKIIVSLVVLSFLASCWNNKQIPEEIDTWVIDKGLNQNINDDNQTGVTDTGSTVNTNWNTKTDNWTNSESNSNSATGKLVEKKPGSWDNTGSDEANLEKEVNDLLDEFIDSLDSYDKK